MVALTICESFFLRFIVTKKETVVQNYSASKYRREQHSFQAVNNKQLRKSKEIDFYHYLKS